MKNFLLISSFLLLSTAMLGQVPLYNSYPSASATIFLDFDGQLVDGTSWNMNGPLSCGPANLTQAQVTEIFNRVSEDYRPFNVNITTDSARYWSAPPYSRMRMILTVTSSWYGSAGGVSFVGSFNWGDNTPGFVFTALLNYNTKYIAEATSHEIGHTLYLRHQSTYNSSCAKTAEYNPGTGSGEIGWAPIMGVGYYRNFTLWNNGTNQDGCNVYQDDLGIITGYNGFTYRSDDHGNLTDASAAIATFTGNQFEVDGVIEKITDKDAFRFSMPTPGNFHLDAVPYNTGTGDAGSNLDMQVDLHSATGTLLGTYNPDVLLNSTIDTFLAAGEYYLVVQGRGNIYAPEYASLGSYKLQASFTPPATLPVHRLELHGINSNNRYQFNWIISADEEVTEQVLERADNGNNFIEVHHASSTDRSYDMPAVAGVHDYRLRVRFDNGQTFFSNIIRLRGKDIQKPVVMGNSVHDRIQVQSPSVFHYELTSLNGSTISNGRLSAGMNYINTSMLPAGFYVIRFTADDNSFAERIMKL